MSGPPSLHFSLISNAQASVSFLKHQITTVPTAKPVGVSYCLPLDTLHLLQHHSRDPATLRVPALIEHQIQHLDKFE